MLKQFMIAACGITTLGLGACASAPGNFNGLGTDAGTMVMIHQNPYYNNGQVSQKSYDVAMKLADNCLKDTHQQMASLGEVVVTNMVADGAAGYVGGWGGEHVEATGINAVLKPGAAIAIGGFNGAAMAAQGAVNGAKVKSSVVSTYVGNCTNGDLHDPIVARMTPGLHVYASQVRTGNSVHKTPSWVVKTTQKTSGLPVDTNPPQPQDPNG